MKFLVTGAAGRLGSQLVQLLSKNEYETRAFDLPSASWGHIENIKQLETFHGDITKPDSVEQACSDVDVIIHLAALLPPTSETNRELTSRVNVDGTRNILRVLRKETTVVLASSISTYGITNQESPLLSEDRPQRSHNNYSDSKIESERLIRASGLPFVILRVAPIAVADLLELPDVVPYRADQRVEFVDVNDAAYSFFQASQNPEATGKTLNIAGGVTWQMTGTEYIEDFYSALGLEVEPNFSEEYTAVDWYDTSRSRFLSYQRTTFNEFLERLKVLGEQLGLR